MKYSEKYGVKRAARKYNKSRSYIYFWKARWDGTVESLADKSKRPHHHPNEHTPDELKLIRDMQRRNPQLGVTELWHRLRKRGEPLSSSQKVGFASASYSKANLQAKAL